VDEDALAVSLQLARSQAQVARDLDAVLGAVHGIGFSDFTLLSDLRTAENSRRRPVDLAARLHLTASGVSRALQPLEKIGLVARESDQRDARVSYARLTPAGIRVLEEATPSAIGACQRLFARLSLGQKRQLRRLLEEISTAR
jgi:DNA-binding MarR family transcriptional regulator